MVSPSRNVKIKKNTIIITCIIIIVFSITLVVCKNLSSDKPIQQLDEQQMQTLRVENLQMILQTSINGIEEVDDSTVVVDMDIPSATVVIKVVNPETLKVEDEIAIKKLVAGCVDGMVTDDVQVTVVTQ